MARKASLHWIGRLLRNILIVCQGEDQAGVLLHVEQQVVQVEHQQLDALLAVREVWMNIIANVDSSGHYERSHLNGVYASISPSLVNSLRR